jgi:hypothetical protein
MSFDLSIAADVKKYLELRKQQIETQSKDTGFLDKNGNPIINYGSVQSQTQLLCGCVVQRWTNQDGTHIVERDWHGVGPHTDGANDP